MAQKITTPIKFITLLFIATFSLIFIGMSLDNETLIKAGFILIPAVLVLFVVTLVILPGIKARKAFEKFAMERNLMIEKTPNLDKNIVNVFSRNNPYSMEKRSILQKTKNLLFTHDNVYIFFNTQSIYGGGVNELQEHLCFLFQILKHQNGYHVITMDDRPFANKLYKGVIAFASDAMKIDNNFIKIGIPEIDDKYSISSTNKEEIIDMLPQIKKSLIDIKDIFSGFSIPRGDIDYKMSNIVIDISGQYCLVRMDHNYAVYLEQIYPLIIELSNSFR